MGWYVAPETRKDKKKEGFLHHDVSLLNPAVQDPAMRRIPSFGY